MKLHPAKWQSRLESMTLKKLYHLYEISKLWQSIGREEVRPAPRFPYAGPHYIRTINKERSKERMALTKRTWQHIEHVYQRIHNRDPEFFWTVYDSCEGAFGFVALWDHWQPSLKQVVCGLQPVDPCTRPAFVKQYLWGDSSDEDL